jgi:glycosyltransferase involved in cell wall biosynthesis
MSRRLKILVLVQGELGASVAGPAVRGLEMSRVLTERHAVTAATPNPRADRLEDLRLVPFTRSSVLREALRHDVVIAPELPPYLLAAVAGRPILTVSDQFGPVELERATLGDDPLVCRLVESQRAMRRLQLRFADVIVSANDAQQERLLGELAALGDRRPRLVTVPFGLPAPPPHSNGHPIRRAIPGVAEDDFVIVWWGSIWRWLDAGTALRAVARIAAGRPHVKFVLPAGRAPDAGADVMDAAADARELAAELGLLGRSVFFMENWIPYEERHAYLQDADLGLVLHADTPEALIAARSRYMDYVWCGVPCVLARGDEIAQRFGEAGFASLVPPLDEDATVHALARLIDDPEALARARAAAPALCRQFRWPELVRPLVEEIEEAAEVARAQPLQNTRALAFASGSYYIRRLGDQLARRRAVTSEPGA